MKDRLIAMNLTGEKLCVDKIDGGVFLVSAIEATMVTCYCPMEEP